MLDNLSKRNGPTTPLETVIGEGTEVQGGVNCPGLARVDGTVNGPIIAHSLFVGIKAVVRGTVSARSVIIGGTVHGDVAAETVDIKKGARLIGDLKTLCISVAEGAVFEGRCSMSKESPRSLEAVPPVTGAAETSPLLL